MGPQSLSTALPAQTAICIGAFDGLHLGHRALVDRARTLAKHVALVTFDPHPAAVLAPDRAPRLLQSNTQRARVASSLNIAKVVLLPFDHEMAALEPTTFVHRYLLGGLAPAAIVVGADFRFGAGRAGDAKLLAELAQPHNIEVIAVEPVPLADASITKLSSSDIRQAVAAGDVQRAGQLLGRWHAVAGSVVHGAKRGRTLGFPTANLKVSGGMIPATGIYASALAVWDQGSADAGMVWPSVTSIGHNPTFADKDSPVSVETFVLDQDLQERLYGVEVEVSFVQRLRGELRFDSAEALVQRMHQDVSDARPWLAPAAIAKVVQPCDAWRFLDRDAEPIWGAKPGATES